MPIILTTKLLAEANQWPEDAAVLWDRKGDDGDECHMAFTFH